MPGQLPATAQARLRRVLSASRSILWEWDCATRQITHEMPSQLWMQRPLPQPLSLLSALRRVHPGDRHAMMTRARLALERRTPYVQHLRLLLGDPPVPVWMEQHGTVICDAQGRAIRLEGLMIDISAHRQALEGLAQADRRKDEFLATLAHELRNPLTAVGAAAQLLSTVQMDPAETSRCIDMIRRQAGQLSRLADDLLDLSHVVRDRLALRRERVFLRDVIRTAIESVQESVRTRGHRLQLTLPPQQLALDADPSRLTQLFGNLLGNAIRYTPDGGSIEVVIEREASWATVRIRDSGMGIGAEHLAHVFEPFYQASQSLVQAQGGLGIGLALARRIVLLHGGSISVQSAGLGRGSEFSVRLPLLAEEAVPLSPPARLEPSRGGMSRAARTLRILIADDNADVAEALGLALRVCGHEVCVALDGEEALAAAEQFQPQVALLDIGMPKLGGHEVAARLRAEHSAPQRPLLIALTGWNTRDLEGRVGMDVFDAQILKPPDIEAITQLIDSRSPALAST